MSLLPSTPLWRAKAWLRERLADGARCPCCNQHAQVYRWSLYSTAARALILYYRLGGTERFVHSNAIKEIGHRGQGDAARLRWWKLVEREVGQRDDGGKSGAWRVTPFGEAFIFNRVSIRKYAHVYDGEPLRFSGPDVRIADALGTKFSYDELVRGLVDA